MLTRLVRIINVSIAAFVLLIVVAIYWYALRPLPKTSGEIEAPLSALATVRRDQNGVPHIEAASWQDAVFLQGFVTAQDRLWQMDGLRRFGGGELAEIAGPGALPLDERARKMRMRAIAEADVKHLRPEDRELFEQYARGVNYFIDTHAGNYSLEFSLPGNSYLPRHWTAVDSALVGLVMFSDLTDGSTFELEKGRFMADVSDRRKASILFPAAQGERESPGSNSWVVSGAHTADGAPMVANDPHLSYTIPATWYLTHLKAPGLNVSGASLPGVPGIITGHNENIAWGVTNLQTDMLDLYAEQMDVRTGRYLFAGHAEQAQLDRQLIRVKNGRTIQLPTWITRHGPVVYGTNGRNFSVRWTAADGFSFPFFDIDRASNWNQFREALSTFWGPPQNFVYGDRAGNIGYQAAGRVPLRPNFDGDVPLDGASGKYEWGGYLLFSQMPSLFNPSSGIIATSNQNPFPANFPYHVGGTYADKYRVDQVRSLLNATAKLQVTDMLKIQKDVFSAFHLYLARQFVAAAERTGELQDLTGQAIAVLRSWDGQMNKDSAAPLIVELARDEIGNSLINSILPAPLQKSFGQMRPRPQVLEKLLRTRPTGWIADDDWDTWLISQLNAAVEKGRARQGSPVSTWKWGQALQWNFAHPVGRQIPFFNRFFNLGPIPMSGAGTTVKQTTANLGPSERMVVDLGDLDRSVQNVTLGESGFVASRHYKDQWNAYYAGTSFPMQFNHVNAKEILHVKPKPRQQ